MKKISLSAISAALFLILVFGYYFAAVIFSDYENVKSEFLSITKINPKAIENAKYEIRQFPIPSLRIEKLVDPGKIEIINADISFSILSILAFLPKANDINVETVRLHINHDDINIYRHDEFISEIISKDSFNLNAKIGNLEFIELDNDVAFSINNFIFNGSGKDTLFKGYMSSVGDINGIFKHISDNEIEFDLKINSQSLSANIYEKYLDFKLKEGKAEIATRNIFSRIAKILPEASQFANNLLSDEEVKITFDMEYANNFLHLKNLQIASDSIDGIGNVAISKNVQDISKIDFNFKKIDLMQLSSNKGKNENSSINLGFGNKLDFRKNRFEANIMIDKLLLNQNTFLSDISFQSRIDDDQFKINTLIGHIDDIGMFKITGSASQNNFRSVFEGKIAMSHPDLNYLAEYIFGDGVKTSSKIPYKLTTDFKLSSVDISLQNMVINTGDNEINGAVSIKFIGDSPRINANIKLAKANIDENNLPAIKKIFDYVKSLTENIKDEGYLNKFIPIRKISSVSNIFISLDQLVFDKQNYNNLSFALNLSPGRMKISDLYISDGKNFLDMGIDLQAQSIKPLVDIRINNGIVPINSLTATSILNFRDYILKNISTDKFNLNFSCYISKLYEDTIELSRVIFTASTRDKLLDISKFEADVFQGRMNLTGSILLDPFTMNFVYVLNSAHINEIAKLLPEGYITTGGVMSASGMWSTNGHTVEELLYNLYSKSNFIAKNIELNNISIDSLIEKTNDNSYNVQNLDKDTKESLLTGKTMISDMQSEFELSKGVFSLPSIKFKTKYSSGLSTATLGIYDFNVNIKSALSFLTTSSQIKGVQDYTTTQLTLTAIGNMFNLKKDADTKALEQKIKDRSK